VPVNGACLPGGFQTDRARGPAGVRADRLGQHTHALEITEDGSCPFLLALRQRAWNCLRALSSVRMMRWLLLGSTFS
jgi:hypothetical protein